MLNKSTNMKFLIDTRAQVSVTPVTSSMKKQNASTSAYKLQAANGLIIMMYGEKILKLILA